MRNLLLLPLLSAAVLCAESPALVSGPATPPARTLWKASLAALTVAHVLDVQSSWGKHELNPVLSGPGGRFGGQGAAIKLGLQGGLMGLEYVITRARPSNRMYRVLSMINFGAAGATAAVATHNYGIARR